MVWIFALGIIGFCIISIGFRKLVFGMVGAIASVAIAMAVYFLYQDHIQKQEAVQTAIAEAKYPACVGKDETIAWLEAGGKCRFATVADASKSDILRRIK